MSMLDSPLEALAIDYLSYGLLAAVNNIWPWLAVITAAVGFWRIRGLSSPPRRSSEVAPLTSSSPPGKMAADAETSASEAATVSIPGKTKRLAPAPLTTSYCVLDQSEGSPKGKFRVYYKDDCKESNDDGDDEGDGGCNGGGAAMEREQPRWGCGDWERMMVVRMGDMGWYRCQNLKVLDGSVVRLWDGRRRRTAPAAALVADGGMTW